MKFLTRIFGVAAAWLLTASLVMAATLLPPGEQQFFDNNGQPLAGGSIYTYVPGTTVNKSTWTNSGQTNFNTNPIILDSAGRAIIYGSGAYRQIVKDQNGNLIWDQITADTSALSSSWGGTSTGTANSQSVIAPNFTSADGQSISFIAGATNTGAFVLTPNSTSPINTLKDTSAGPVSLTGGEIVQGNQVTVVYDATLGAFHLVTPPINTTPSFTSLSVSGPIKFTGTIVPTALTTTTSNWNPTGLSGASIIQASSTVAVQVTGLVAQPIGTIISFQNVGSFSITLVPSSSSSTAANQFAFPRAELVQPGQSVLIRYDAAASAWKLFQGTTSYVLPAGFKRQTVASGPTDGTTGLPNFLPATSASRNLTTQNITASAPLIVTAASGFNLSGAADLFCQATANLTWSSLTVSTTSYLFLTVNADGSCTPGATTTLPIYLADGTTPSTTSGQYTFDTLHYQMWLGNGTTATRQTVVFVGEATTSASAVTAAIAYAYQGRFDSGFITGLPGIGQTTVLQSNLGVEGVASLSTKNVVTQSNYSVGDVVTNLWCALASAATVPPAIGQTRNSVWFTTGSTVALGTMDKSNGTSAGMTSASWAYRLTHTRLW